MEKKYPKFYFTGKLKKQPKGGKINCSAILFAHYVGAIESNERWQFIFADFRLGRMHKKKICVGKTKKGGNPHKNLPSPPFPQWRPCFALCFSLEWRFTSEL